MFSSWPKCHEHVDGFPGASYKKFNSTDEAYKAISSVNVGEKVSEKSESHS